MVAIFAKTTTSLSLEFLEKLPEVLLDVTIDNINNIPGVNCEKIDDTFYLKGQWHDLVTAYVSLEQCLDNDSDKEDVKTDVDEIVQQSQTNDSEHGVSPDIDYNFVTIKKEKDAEEFQEPDEVEDAEAEVEEAEAEDPESDDDVKEITDPETEDYDKTEVSEEEDKNEIKRKLRTRTRRGRKRVKYNFGTTSSGKFSCTKCDYVGKLEKHLQNHMVRKHQRNYKCNTCDKKYGYKADLERHKLEVHTKSANYYCNICDKYLKTKAYIDDHMSMHLDNYVYHCKTCDKSFSTKNVFGKHMRQKHPSTHFDVEELDDVLPDTQNESKSSEKTNEENASNDDTNDANEEKLKNNEQNDESLENSQDMDYLYFPEMKDKIIHENNLVKVTLKRGKNRGRPRIKSYVDGRTEFPCNLCNYIGKKECHLEYHIIRNHSQKFICDICQKQFGYNWDLKRHREQVHAEASYICHICSKAYKVKKSFDEHLRSHEEGYVKSVFPCSMCDKTFSAKQVLENHVKIKHLGVKQKEKQKYLCQTCGAEFYHKYSYQSHMNKHAGLMPYNCDICGKAFASEHSVKEHQITHRDSREFHCHICPKSFKTSSALNAHVAIHANKRDFKCSVCGKGFIQKQSLIRHERIHSGYKPFTCAQCSRVFTDSATIRKHMILVHKSDPHDWQGDVISDLKKQGELWPGDLTSEPKKEPDFRRKADRERAMEIQAAANAASKTNNDSLNATQTSYQPVEQNLDLNQRHNEMNPRMDVEMNRQNESNQSQNEFGQRPNELNQRPNELNPLTNELNQRPNELNHGPNDYNQRNDSDMSHMNNQNNLHRMVNNDMNQGASNSMMDSSSTGNPDHNRQPDFWRATSYSDTHRPVDTWNPGTMDSRQSDPMRVDNLLGMKRPNEFFQPGLVVDATRHSSSEYFHGDNIPDPRKQIEFWQGQTIPDGKQHPNDQMQNQLTTLQNMNYHPQS